MHGAALAWALAASLGLAPSRASSPSAAARRQPSPRPTPGRRPSWRRPRSSRRAPPEAAASRGRCARRCAWATLAARRARPVDRRGEALHGPPARPRAGVPRQLQGQRRRLSPRPPARASAWPRSPSCAQHDGQDAPASPGGWTTSGWTSGRGSRRSSPSPTPRAWNRQMWVVRLFDQLIYNTDRNLGNLLIDKDWRLWMIDHTRAFKLFTEPKSPKNLAPQCARGLLEGCDVSTRPTLAAATKDLLSRGPGQGPAGPPRLHRRVLRQADPEARRGRRSLRPPQPGPGDADGGQRLARAMLAAPPTPRAGTPRALCARRGVPGSRRRRARRRAGARRPGRTSPGRAGSSRRAGTSEARDEDGEHEPDREADAGQAQPAADDEPHHVLARARRAPSARRSRACAA